MWYEPRNNVLIYDTPADDRIVRTIPSARQLHNGYVAVPRTLHNCQLLRWLQFPVAPIMTGYDWPRNVRKIAKPTSAQMAMANFCVLHPRCFNLSDMGTMKTLATLWAADWLMSQFPKGACRAIIVAPLSILQRVWGDAIFENFLGRRDYAIVYGSQDKRRKILAEPHDFYVINFDGVGIGAHTRKKFELDGLSKDLARRTDIQIAIVDEGSAYRDSRTKRHRIAQLVLRPRHYFWMLTGTPLPNGPTDAFGLAKLINNAFGESWSRYHERVMYKIGNFRWLPRHNSHLEAQKLLTPSIRFDIKDVWDGPTLTTQQREVPLSAAQAAAMAELRRNAQLLMKSGHTIPVANEAALRNKLIQIACGAVYDGDHTAHRIDCAPRLEELKSILEQAARKVLIFAPLTSVVNMLYKELDGYTRAVVNGAVAVKERNELFRRFLSDVDPRIIIADPGTIAHGINELVAADTVVWFGPTDKTELYLQGNKRAHRPGQRHPVTIVQLVSHRIEREIYRRLETNESMQGLVLDLIKGG